jgi:hypothetical protein
MPAIVDESLVAPMIFGTRVGPFLFQEKRNENN